MRVKVERNVKDTRTGKMVTDTMEVSESDVTRLKLKGWKVAGESQGKPEKSKGSEK